VTAQRNAIAVAITDAHADAHAAAIVLDAVRELFRKTVADGRRVKWETLHVDAEPAPFAGVVVHMVIDSDAEEIP
jgi:hypothetical protein